MTKKINSDIFARFAENRPRAINSTNPRYNMLLVCEGLKTEPNYFRQFPSNIRNCIIDLDVIGGANNTLQVVEEALRHKNMKRCKYDSIWAVFDKDSFPADKFDNAINKAKQHNIKCAWSNEAFEIWYLLHFINRITAMPRKDYKKILTREIERRMCQLGQRNINYTYAKNDENMYSILNKYGDQKQAIEWAKQLTRQYNNLPFHKQNPCTLVYKLVEELNGDSKELIKQALTRDCNTDY